MLQNFFCLAAIITVAYSDCCTDSDISISGEKCDDNNTIECHMKHYGIYCCNTDVTEAIEKFANISNKIVRLN